MSSKNTLAPTSLGVLPDAWPVAELGSLAPFVTSGARGWADHYAEQGDAFIRITNMSRESISLDLTDLKRVALPTADREGIRTGLRDGDLLISITADIGIVGLVDSTVPKPAYINQHIALVRFDTAKVDTQFLAYFLASEHPQRAFRASTDQGAKAGMNLAGVRRVLGAFPPLLEQRAIAAALSAVDALRGALNRLIDKKRDLKQAAMQQLLTGRTRLPAFSDGSGHSSIWRSTTVRGVASSARNAIVGGPFGSDLVSRDYVDDGVPVIRGQNMGERWVSGAFAFVTPAKARSLEANLARPGDIIFTQRGTLGQVAIVPDNPYGAYLVSQSQMKVTVDRDVVDPTFLFYVFKSQAYQQLISDSAIQTGVPHINLGILRAFPIALPSRLEQIAIAAVLSDMDAEIAALDRRRDKTRLLKQGMMQELLTGRTRLI